MIDIDNNLDSDVLKTGPKGPVEPGASQFTGWFEPDSTAV